MNNNLPGIGGFYNAAGSNSGEITFPIAGTFTWSPPSGVTKVSVVCVSGGGGGGTDGAGGGALSYTNNIKVSAAKAYTVTVGLGGLTIAAVGDQGGSSLFKDVDTTYCEVSGGHSVTTGARAGGLVVKGVGFAGGAGQSSRGGGAGGYSGIGGAGNSAAPAGGGGGGGGGFGGGGGVGLNGEGVSGASNGGGGSGGSSSKAKTGIPYSEGAKFGGGGSGSLSDNASSGGDGGVRIIWGSNRTFPDNAGAL